MPEDFLTPEERERLRQKVQPQQQTGADIAPLRMADVRYGTTAPAQLGQAPAAGTIERMVTESGQELASPTQEQEPVATAQPRTKKQREEARHDRWLRRQRRRKRREATRWQKNVVSLFDKVVTSRRLGYEGTAPVGISIEESPHLVPFSEIPVYYRNRIASAYPKGNQPLYFDRRLLNDEENVVLAKLMAANRDERAVRVAASQREQQDMKLLRADMLRKLEEGRS